MTTPDYDAYVICTSPRSGSTLLCTLLAATGIAGKPESYFHEPSVADWVADLGLPLDVSRPEPEFLGSVFHAVIAKGSAGTGMFGLRLQRHSFDFFTSKLAVLHPDLPTDLDRFQAAFGRTLFLHLTREDKIDQGVSLVRAQQSGLWHRAPDGSEIERLSPPQEPRYDRDEIAGQVAEMKDMDAAWTQWFAAQGIRPLRLTYDGLAADPRGTLARVLTRLGLDSGAAAGIEPGVVKLADRTNREWVTRYRADARGKA